MKAQMLNRFFEFLDSSSNGQHDSGIKNDRVGLLEVREQTGQNLHARLRARA